MIRRDFLVKNEISITNEMANDMLLTLFLVYSAKRFVRVPYVINFYRVLSTSLTHQKRDPLKQLKKYMNALIVGFSHLDNFLDKQPFFKANLPAKYMALNTYFQEILTYLNPIYAATPMHVLDDTLQEAFAPTNNAALSAFTFNFMNTYRLQLIQAQQRFVKFNQFAAQAQARIAQLEAEVKRLKQ